jgi:peroxiredoxin
MRTCAGIVVVVVGCVLAGRATHAQSFAAFDFKSQPALVVPAFTDTELKQLTETLDRFVGSDPDVVWQFARRMQAGRLSPPQETRVLAHLDVLARAQPDRATKFAGAERMIRDLTVAKVAPPITGTDLNGRTFSLADYRNQVVVLIFSADWCGICRAQAPYERFLLDRYANWPLAILGVETGSNRDAARQAQANDPRSTRAWWDAPRAGQANGPIASAWNVIGWPANYVIDGDGVIRFVDVRDEDLLKAVRQLVEVQVDRDAAVRRK